MTQLITGLMLKPQNIVQIQCDSTGAPSLGESMSHAMRNRVNTLERYGNDAIARLPETLTVASKGAKPVHTVVLGLPFQRTDEIRFVGGTFTPSVPDPYWYGEGEAPLITRQEDLGFLVRDDGSYGLTSETTGDFAPGRVYVPSESPTFVFFPGSGGDSEVDNGIDRSIHIRLSDTLVWPIVVHTSDHLNGRLGVRTPFMGPEDNERYVPRYSSDGTRLNPDVNSEMTDDDANSMHHNVFPPSLLAKVQTADGFRYAQFMLTKGLFNSVEAMDDESSRAVAVYAALLKDWRTYVQLNNLWPVADFSFPTLKAFSLKAEEFVREKYPLYYISSFDMGYPSPAARGVLRGISAFLYSFFQPLQVGYTREENTESVS